METGRRFPLPHYRAAAAECGPDFKQHRWIAGHREVAYSDWLQWILAPEAAEVLRVFGVDDPEVGLACTGAAVMIARERCVPEGTQDPRDGLILKSG